MRLHRPVAGREIRARDDDVQRPMRRVLLERLPVLVQANREAQRVAGPDAEIGERDANFDNGARRRPDPMAG